MRLLSAELLAMRKRAATYVVLAVLLAVMAIVYLLIGLTAGAGGGPALEGVLEFPDAYAVIGQFVFGLGSLMAVAYAAAVAGADWNWGIPRLLLSRGESRVMYVLAKAAGVAIMLAIGVLIAHAVGIALTFVAGAMLGVSTGNPLTARGLEQLVESLALGYPVLIERAAIAFAVAVLLRSQLAGIVIGIVLYIGEGIARGILFTIQFFDRFQSDDVGFNFEPVGPEWYQYLPFTLGDSVLGEIATAQVGGGGGLEGVLLRPVPLEPALVGVGLYLLAALVISVVAVWRAEITA